MQEETQDKSWCEVADEPAAVSKIRPAGNGAEGKTGLASDTCLLALSIARSLDDGEGVKLNLSL